MDDFIISNLNESRNEWCERLIYILVPHINEGIKSIFNEAMKMCIENNETSKYLMTFQNLLSKIPQWNSVIVQDEVTRIVNKSGCNYISELISCVHIIQLKILTCIRVGNKQKKIDIAIPKLNDFIHKIYIHVARKMYTNVYLLEKGISPLQIQKNNREIEIFIRECILITIRESIPTEQIVRAYLDESIEHEEEIIIEDLEEPIEPTNIIPSSSNSSTNEVDKTIFENSNSEIKENSQSNEKFTTPTIQNINNDKDPVTTLKFNDIDYVLDENDNKTNKQAPKDIKTLEEISVSNTIKRKLQEEKDDEEEDVNDKIQIHSDNINIDNLDVFDIETPNLKIKSNLNDDIFDIEELR
jgi:hypothetical protein